MKNRFLPVIAALLIAMLIIPAGCAELGIPSPGDLIGSQPTTGRLEVRVTDAPPEKVITAIDVTVASVEINIDGGETGEGSWQSLTVLEGKSTFDLLQVQGLEELLATSDLEPGVYNQIRMEVTKVLVTFEGEEPVEATLPSGKLKFIRPFEIVAGKTTVLLFDFIASESIHTAGNSGKVIFQPVIKLSVTQEPGAIDITTETLPDGIVETAYTTALAVMGGTAPYAWSVVSGNLPAGLILDAATGIISGIPTTAGEYTFTLTVSDSSSPVLTDTQELTIEVDPAATT
ncbi:DUF4382 domain-containing protein [Dehalogenimonas sp. THU2]|uniref:DUF4382 domain-containing protein n=1 Tax=Dehalogenimonas sp. THU2 TaxID=3151121 RepID=UPI0032184674